MEKQKIKIEDIIKYNPTISKVDILLQSGEHFCFLIEAKNKEKTLKSLIKKGDFRVLDYDFVIFDGLKGKAVVNISEIDAFTIEDVSWEEPEVLDE